MTYYRDESGDVWCFTSNDYSDLLRSKVNPTTGRPLPEAFLVQVKANLEILEKLGIPVATPVAISEALTQLKRPDVPDNRESEAIVKAVLSAGRLDRIPSVKVSALTPEQMNQVLRTIGMDQESLTIKVAVGDEVPTYVLTPDHQLITFARAARMAMEREPSLATTFYSNLALVAGR
jgi:hypothetical protein